DGAVALHGDGAVVYRAGVLGELGDAQLVVLDAITRGGVGQFVAVGDERRQRFFGQVEGRGDERRAGLKQDLGGQAGGVVQALAVGRDDAAVVDDLLGVRFQVGLQGADGNVVGGAEGRAGADGDERLEIRHVDRRGGVHVALERAGRDAGRRGDGAVLRRI